MAAEFDDFGYPDPIQPGVAPDSIGGDGLVHRQAGLPPAPQGGIDPTPPAEVIQGSVDIFTTRNTGPHVTQRYGADGTLKADRPSDRNTFHVDHALSDPEAMPPGLARIAAPLVADPNQQVTPRPAFDAPSSAPPAVQTMDRAAIKALAEAHGFTVSDASPAAAQPTAIDVIASDTGSPDPRDKGSRPMVFTADALPVIKKRPIVPVDVSAPNALPEPRTRRVVPKAGPTVKAAAKTRRVKAKARN